MRAVFLRHSEGRSPAIPGFVQSGRRLSHATGIHVAPHKLRHTFGIEYLRSGGSVFALQKTLGHTSLDTTLRYAALVTDDLVDAHREHSPVARIVKGRAPRGR
jgi:site-specific recombinase XerD